MVDVDGVVVVPPPGGWAASLEVDLGLSPAVLHAQFFQAHWDDVLRGRAGLHERLAPVLAQVAPHLTSEALVAYWFEKDANLDHALLAELADVRAGGLPVHLATVQEPLRAAYVWDHLGLRDHFDAMHYAAEFGARKTEPEFYAAIEARTGFRGDDLLLLDDTAANVDAARAAGWGGVVWTGRERLAEVLSDLR